MSGSINPGWGGGFPPQQPQPSPYQPFFDLLQRTGTSFPAQSTNGFPYASNPVGTQNVNQQFIGMPTGGFDPLVDPRLTPFASRPLTQAEYEQMMRSVRDSSLSLFAQLALAGTAPETGTQTATFAPHAPVSAAAVTPAAAPAAGRSQAIMETNPFGTPSGAPDTDPLPIWLAKYLYGLTAAR